VQGKNIKKGHLEAVWVRVSCPTQEGKVFWKGEGGGGGAKRKGERKDLHLKETST